MKDLVHPGTDESNPCADALERSPQAWEGVATDVVGAIVPDALLLARKLSDDLYAHLLFSIQDNLADNALFNLKSRLDAAERHARESWLLTRAIRDERDALREAARRACDLLAERTYGNPARSPGHNARLALESALVAAPMDHLEGQDEVVPSSGMTKS